MLDPVAFAKSCVPILIDVRMACRLEWEGDSPEWDLRLVCALLGAQPIETPEGNPAAALSVSNEMESGRYVVIYSNGLMVTRQCVSVMEACNALRACSRLLATVPPVGMVANFLNFSGFTNPALTCSRMQLITATAECYIGPVDLRRLAVYTAASAEAANPNTRNLTQMKSIDGQLTFYFSHPNVMVMVNTNGRVVLQVQGSLEPGWNVDSALIDAQNRCKSLVGSLTPKSVDLANLATVTGSGEVPDMAAAS